MAAAAHDELVDRLHSRGLARAWLRVFTANGRGRRFYEKHGWRPTGERDRSSYPPHAELLVYDKEISPVTRPVR